MAAPAQLRPPTATAPATPSPGPAAQSASAPFADRPTPQVRVNPSPPSRSRQRVWRQRPPCQLLRPRRRRGAGSTRTSADCRGKGPLPRRLTSAWAARGGSWRLWCGGASARGSGRRGRRLRCAVLHTEPTRPAAHDVSAHDLSPPPSCSPIFQFVVWVFARARVGVCAVGA